MVRRKKEGVTLNFQDLITQPRQLARLPMMNKMAGYRVLIAVLQRLQGLWRIAKMPENAKNGQLYMNFVTDEFEVKRKKEGVYNEGDVVFKLRLSDIALDSHYDEARKALAEITHIKCFIPDRDNPGYYRTGSLMEVRGRREGGQFVGTEFEVIVPNLTAENILDINLFSNYTRFVGYTAGRLRSSFSYPLYIYLSEEWRHHGDQFTIPMRDLRTRLGFVKNDEDPGRENRYAIWSQFCQKVLDQAKRELAELAKVGGADFTFEYQGMLHGLPLPRFKRPDSVAFTILPTKAGEKLQQINDYTPNREAAKRMMADFFRLNVGQIYNLLRRVSPDFMDTFIKQLNKWRNEIQGGARTDIKNLPAWAYESIDRLIRDEEARHINAQTSASSPITSSPSSTSAPSPGTSPASTSAPSPSASPASTSAPSPGTAPASSTSACRSGAARIRAEIPASPSTSSSAAVPSASAEWSSPSVQYDFAGDRLTLTADEQQMLHDFTTDLHLQFASTLPAFVSDIVSRLIIHRVRDTNRCVTLALDDSSHITPDRINYFSSGLYAQFYAIFNAHFPGYRFCFD